MTVEGTFAAADGGRAADLAVADGLLMVGVVGSAEASEPSTGCRSKVSGALRGGVATIEEKHA